MLAVLQLDKMSQTVQYRKADPLILAAFSAFHTPQHWTEQPRVENRWTIAES
jgi:hypothetical protein